MKNTEVTYIYILIDPRDNTVRYVGKTSNPKYRLSGHISECKKENILHRRAKWIRNLLKEGLKPIITFIKVCPLSQFEKYESYYIKLYSSHKLTNSDEDGQGNKNRKREVLDRQSKKSGKKVYQYKLDGTLLKWFRSVRSAAVELKLNHGNISKCCNGIFEHTGGFIFRYKRLDYIKKVESPNAVKKSIIEVDIEGNEINRWVSIMECSRDTKLNHGNLSKVCSGKLKSISKRFFKTI
jgi:hypothetical protein